MAAGLRVFPSQAIDLVNQSGSVSIYTVPQEWMLVLYGIDLITISSSGLSAEPIIEIGNSGSATAYQQTYLQGTYNYIPSVPSERQVAPAGTTITATIQTNSVATSHKGLVVLVGYLVPATAFGIQSWVLAEN
jgi:hypothetical protein